MCPAGGYLLRVTPTSHACVVTPPDGGPTLSLQWGRRVVGRGNRCEPGSQSPHVGKEEAFMLARIIVLCAATWAAWPAASTERGPVVVDTTLFTVLPADFRNPESLATDPSTGQVYLGSFDAREPASSRDNQVLRLSPQGEVLARVRLGPTPVTGLGFHDGHVYLLNFGASSLQRLPAGFTTGASPVTVMRA